MRISMSSLTSAARLPSPRSSSASALLRIRTISSAVSARKTWTLQRESRAEITSKEGFSVVAPMRTMSPCSTYGKKASCCALLKRWISSTKITVRRPERCIRWASAMTALTSLILLNTALNETNWQRVA